MAGVIKGSSFGFEPSVRKPYIRWRPLKESAQIARKHLQSPPYKWRLKFFQSDVGFGSSVNSDR